MGRPRRFDEPGYVQHVVQRGHDRQAIFLDRADREDYRRRLGLALHQYGGALHAYVLMGNHVHLLLTPGEQGGVGRVMQAVSRNYAACFNRRSGRRGSLWEGRYRSSTIDSERYFYTCMRYIELNPVRAGLAGGPALYRWTSHHANALGRPDPLVTPHALYLSLGEDSAARRAAYLGLFRQAVPEATFAALRAATRAARPFGDEAFRDRLRKSVSDTNGV